MKKINDYFPNYFLLALTWFGFHCGAGFCSGKLVWMYVSQYGTSGIVVPLIVWVMLAIYMFFVAEYARLVKAKSYKDLVSMFSGNKTIQKFILYIWDILFFIGILYAGSGCTAGCGSLLENIFGISYWLGCVLFISFMSFMIGFGKNLLRKLGGMGIVLLIAFFVICFVAIYTNYDHLLLVMQNPKTYGAPLKHISRSGLVWGAFLYVFGQVSFLHTCSIGAGKFANRGESVKFVICGALINMFAMYVSYFAQMAYYPECGYNTLPLFGIVSNLSGVAGIILMIVYNITLFLAYVTTVGASLYGTMARYVSLLGKIIHNETKCRIFFVMSILCISLLLSSLGLEGVIKFMLTVHSYTRFPFWFLSIIIFAPFAIYRVKRGEKEK